MCGIAAALDLKGRPVNKAVVKAMTEVQAHRGPNDEGIFLQGSVGLGHRRLSILDLSKAACQPMQSSSGHAHLAFNGEIYNYIELKKELPQITYRSEGDTEVLLHAYETWGVECLEQLNGIFGFALWDDRSKSLFAARDRLGVKPLYYAIHDGVFYLASEIKALLAAGVPAEPHDAIIHDYIVHGFYEHSEETFFKGIKQVPAGHYLLVGGGGVTLKRYWYLPDRITDLSGLSDSDVVHRYRELVTRSVTMQMRSDVQIGIPASGGLDCSILTEVVNRISGGQKNFRLYSWTYGDPRYDERPYVEELAKALGWTVDFFELSPELTLELMPHVVRTEEQPFPGISIVARHNLYRQAHAESIVMLEGHGGDEIGAGYPYYFSSFLLDLIATKGFAAAEKEFEAYAHACGLDEAQARMHFRRGVEAYVGGGVSADATRFAHKKYVNEAFADDVKRGMPQFEKPFKSFLSNLQYRDLLHTKEPRVLRSVDRNAMAYGREVRVPFLDHSIVEFAFSLAGEHKIRNAEQRFFMREAFRDSLPASIINTPKRAVPDPQRAWLKGPLRSWAEDILTSSSFAARPYFNHQVVLEEFKRYCSDPAADNSFHIWQWLNLELWFREFID